MVVEFLLGLRQMVQYRGILKYILIINNKHTHLYLLFAVSHIFSLSLLPLRKVTFKLVIFPLLFREATKKILLSMAGPLRPYPPPSDLMAIELFFFLS